MDRTSLVSYQEQVVVIGLDGHIRILSEGSQPRNGEIIVERVSQSDLKVELVKDEQSTDVSDDIAQIIETLESGQDPTQLSEEFATAAGTANGSSYQLTATLERSASEILAATDFQTSGLHDLGVSQTQTLSLLEAYLNFNQVISSASGNPDTLAPSVPTVVITEDSNNDGSLENNEVDGVVDVLVTLPADAQVGDTLSVTGQPDRVITQNDLDNGVTLQYPVPAEGETLTVVATVTDQAGNTSEPGQDAVTVPTVEVPDTDAPDAPTVVITEDSNNDGSLENNEVDGLVDVLVTLPANAEVGDTLSVTGQPDRVITQNDLDNGVMLQYPVPAEGETLTVVATITDQAGNTSEPGQDAVTVPTVEVPDTDAPDAPTVVITEDSNNDGSLENNEVDGLVDVLVTLPANAEVGDTLSVTGQPDRVITQNDLDNGVTLQYPIPAEGETLTVVATVTDQAGNTSEPGQDAVTVPTVEVPDTDAPDAPTVVITEDSNNDGSLENNEVDGLVDVLVTLPANAEVGDTLSVTGQPGRVITQNDLDNGVTLQYPVPAEGEMLTVVATITDQAGNTSEPGQDAVTVPTVEVPDTDAPDAPTVVITEDSNNDGLLENNEVDGLVDVLVTLPANAEVGDTLSVTGQPDRVITQNDLDNGVTLQYPVPVEGEALTVVATITDQAGNTSDPGQDAVTVPTVEIPDTTAPGEGVDDDSNPDNDINSIAFIDDNNVLNEDELKAIDIEGQVEADGTINSIVISGVDEDGKPVSYALKESEYRVDDNGKVTITDLDLSGVGFADGNLTVTMSVTDKAGNAGSVNDTINLDTTAPGEGVDDDSNPDNDINSIAFIDDNNVLSEDELKAVDIEGQVEADGTINSIVISGVDEDGKPVSYALKESEYRVDDNGKVTITDLNLSGVGFVDGNLTVTMSVTDKAGNAGSVNDSINLDTTAPGDGEGEDGADLGPIVHIVDDVNNDGLINEAELGQDNVQITVTVNHEELLNGGHVTLQVGEREVSLKLDDGKLVNLDGSEQNTYEYKEGVISWT
ncbi:Ig-like domain repeat protein, partial [Vibrio rotiferianus]|uniref:Ig-like domain repeat protein n=1 Tax=Vibrio rotiferianus TaxID=190895 RepID=UPI0014874E09